MIPRSVLLKNLFKNRYFLGNFLAKSRFRRISTDFRSKEGYHWKAQIFCRRSMYILRGLTSIKTSLPGLLRSRFFSLKFSKNQNRERGRRPILFPCYDFLVRSMLTIDKNEGDFQGGPYFASRTPNSYRTPP